MSDFINVLINFPIIEMVKQDIAKIVTKFIILRTNKKNGLQCKLNFELMDCRDH